MTKSIVALAVGRAVTLGALSLDDSIGDYLDGLDAQRGAITVRELLTQSSGLRFAWANDLAGSTEDSVDQALSMPIAHTPGTTFEYAQTTVNVLVAVVQASVGHDFQSFIDAELFGPVGIERDGWTWMRDGVGNTHGYAWLDLAPRNVARLATLFLHDGVWQGRRIISADYLDAMATPSPTNPGYGFLSQLNAGEWYVESFGNTVRSGPRLSTAPADTVHWSGFLDQDTFIVPSLDMVIVRTGLPMDSRWRYELFRRLAAATPELVAADPSAGPPPEFEIVIKWSQIADLETLLKRLATNTSVG